MKTTLTDRLLRNLKPPEADRLEISDTKRVGLRFRLYPSGRGVWMYEKRIKNGPKRKHTLGGWPSISLSEARSLALELEVEAAQGIDRVAVSENQRLEVEASRAGLKSVEQVIEIYDQLHLTPNLRTGSERKRQLQQSLKIHLGKPIADLTKSDLQHAVDKKALLGRTILANRIRAALIAFSNWAWQRGYLTESIGAGISKAGREAPRERVLSLAETQEIYNASYKMGDLWGPLIRLLLLTAQRRSDITKLKWSEVDFQRFRISLSGSRTKNGKPHITHLSAPVVKELESLKSRTGNSKYVFTTTGTTPVSGLSKVKKRLDGLLSDDFPSWRFHDIRTGFATGLAELGESETIVDRILNHVASGSAPGAVARVYNQAEQLPQRAKVLDRWAEMVTANIDEQN